MDALRNGVDEWSSTGSRRSEYLSLGLLLVVVAGSYLLLMPGNRSETDDGFGYAHAARSAPITFDPDHALLVPVGKALSAIWDPYTALVGFSLACGLATLGMFYVLLRSLAFQHFYAMWAVGLLAASYGFWRYAVEAETYTVGTLLALLVCVAAVRGWALPVLYLFVAGAMLGHILNLAVLSLPFRLCFSSNRADGAASCSCSAPSPLSQRSSSPDWAQVRQRIHLDGWMAFGSPRGSANQWCRPTACWACRG